jgi:C-terminal processing protease CtpA/Prc
MRRRYALSTLVGILMCFLLVAPEGRAQFGSGEQGMLKDMLRACYNDVNKHYYDPTFHSVDLNARYKYYLDVIGKSSNWNQGFGIIASFVDELNDSHTFFVPPRRAEHHESGFRYALVGDKAFVTQVRPNTDAASKIHIGDQIVAIGYHGLNRSSFDMLEYTYGTLSPWGSVHLELMSPTGKQYEENVNAWIGPTKGVVDYNTHDYVEEIRREQDEAQADRSTLIEDGDIAIWKIQGFQHDIDQIEKIVGIARKHKTLILDLRGNGGGDVICMKLVLGSLFEHEVKIGDRVTRNSKGNKPMNSLQHGSAFTGQLIVLVDAGSASASEIVARVVQLEHRGIVIGDKTTGKVMEAEGYEESWGGDTKVYYGFSITSANLIMTDGKSLEKVGVTPDVLMVPTAADLAAGHDRVLSHAAELGGVKLTPETAGKQFPYDWLPL